jgi:predicted  nucleic acid-binding Zn-ribbon protein
MADVTWGVKVSEELKEKIVETVQQSGLSGKEFVESLLLTHEMQKLKEMQPIMKADVEELQSLISRINNIFLNLGERIENIGKTKDQEYKIAMEGKDSTIQLYYTKIKGLESEIEQLRGDKEELNINFEGLINRKNELENLHQTNTALIQEYKEKNDTLTGLLSEYKQFKDDVIILKGELEKEQEKQKELLASLTNIKKDSDAKVADMRTSTSKEIESLKQKINQIESKAKDNIITVQEKADMAKEKSNMVNEKAIIELRTVHQTDINKLHDSYNKKIQEILMSIKPMLQTAETIELEKAKENNKVKVQEKK